jgi:hypothetical protein
VSQGVQFATPPLTPFVKRLIIVLASAFVLELVLTNFVSIPVIQLLALWPSMLGVQTLWQVFTYVLVEPPQAVGSVLIGLLFMWLIMSPFELRFGSRRTFELSVVATLSASLAALIVGFVINGSPPLFGSNAIAYAGMAATARSIGGGKLSLFGLVQLTPNQLLGLLAGLAVLMFLATRDHTQLVASIAALAAGVGYIEWMRNGPSMFARTSKTRRSGFRVVQGGRDSDRPKWLN